jgi:hypothetical protein
MNEASAAPSKTARTMGLARHASTLASILLCLGMVGCDSAGDDAPPARIVPGESVEGIPLGASKAEAEAVLGEFRTSCRADGFDRAWCTASFFGTNFGDSLGLELGFIEEWAPEGFWREGPLDFFWVTPPYDGTTKEGIGIGSRKALVQAAYGSPDSIRIHTGHAHFYYCFGHGRRFGLTIYEDMVTRIDIGNFKPLPDGIRICD